MSIIKNYDQPTVVGCIAVSKEVRRAMIFEERVNSTTLESISVFEFAESFGFLVT